MSEISYGAFIKESEKGRGIGKSHSRLFEYKGKLISAEEVMEIIGCSRSTVWKYLIRFNYSVEDLKARYDRLKKKRNGRV